MSRAKWIVIGLIIPVAAGACARSEEADSTDVAVTAQELSSTPAPAQAPTAASAAPATAISADERAARDSIKAESIDAQGPAAKRAYQDAERAALRAALETKRTVLQQAQKVRPSKASAERDMIDAEITEMKTDITTSEQKLAELDK